MSACLRQPPVPAAGVSSEALHDALQAEGFVISAGQEDPANTLFRISTMSNLTAANVDRLLADFARFLG